jgi:hypothetical protein
LIARSWFEDAGEEKAGCVSERAAGAQPPLQHQEQHAVADGERTEQSRAQQQWRQLAIAEQAEQRAPSGVRVRLARGLAARGGIAHEGGEHRDPPAGRTRS